MTLTQTLPQGLDLTPDLEAWLRGEIEKPCEVVSVKFDPFTGRVRSRTRCTRRATWLAYLRRERCDHQPATVTGFLCNKHKKREDGDLRCDDGGAFTCPGFLIPTYIERIRKRWWR